MTTRLVVVATIALAGTAALLILLTPEAPFMSETWGFRGYDVLFAVTFAALGAVILSHRPRHLVGRLFLGTALLSAMQSVTASYAAYSYLRGAPGGAVAEWVNDWIWLSSVMSVALVLIVFPDGRPISRAWRWLAWALVVGLALATVLWAVATPESGGFYPELDVLGIGEARTWRTISATSASVLVVALLAGVLSLIVRSSRGSWIERQQIKWVALAAAFGGAALASTLVAFAARADLPLQKATEISSIASYLLIVAATAVAILRYRLYDIDVLINRTLVYGAVSATLAVTYFVGLVLLQRVFSPLTQGSDIAVALSTLAVAALFQPLRARTQRFIDRRFYRHRYDASKTIDAFAARLRQEVDLDEMSGELVSVVRQTVEPAHVSLWLRTPPERVR